MRKNKLLALGLAALMAASVAGCSTPSASVDDTKAAESGSDSSQSAAAGEKIFRYSNTADIATIDPDKTNSVADATVSYHIYDGLYRNVQGELQPATAESYEVSDDGLVYTFKLRQDTKWSDGQTVTAKDYEYGMKRLCDPAAACPASYLGAVLKNGAKVSGGELSVDELGVKALDDFTLEITLENPADYFVSMTSMSAFMPVREADQTTAVSMFDAGELDLAEVPTELAAQYEGKTQSYYSGADDYAALNHRNKYLANKNLRLAMNYAVNREEYILLTHNGLYQANQRYVLPQVRGVDGEYGTEYPLEAFPLQGDMDKAKEYLDTALSELGLSSASDISLKLVVADSDTAKKEAEVVANQWKNNLGINVDINMVPYATRNALLVPDSDEYDIIMSGWAPDYSDPYSYLELWYSTSGYNYLNYHSDEYDKYIDASKTTSGKERMDNLFNAEKTLLEDGALVPLQLREVPYMVSDRVQNLGAYFVGLNYDYMYVDITK